MISDPLHNPTDSHSRCSETPHLSAGKPVSIQIRHVPKTKALKRSKQNLKVKFVQRNATQEQLSRFKSITFLLNTVFTEPKSNRTEPETAESRRQRLSGRSAVWKCGITAFSSVRRRNIKADVPMAAWGGTLRPGSMTSLSPASRARDRHRFSFSWSTTSAALTHRLMRPSEFCRTSGPPG